MVTPGRRSGVAAAVACAVVLGCQAGIVAQSQAPADKGYTILFGNDDGFDAPGLQAVVQAFAGYGELYVAAPAQNQSGKGHSITISDPIIVRERSIAGVEKALSIVATPATAARVGLEKYLPRRPDLVISGINRGENLGTSVYLSGTLGAAREAAFSRIPAIAVSMQGDRSEDYVAAAAFVRRLVEDLRARQLLQPGVFLNVNVPSGFKGVRVTRLSTTPSKQVYDCSPPVRDRAVCFSGYEQIRADEPDTDVAAFFGGFIAVTPMTLDVTDAQARAGLAAVEKLVDSPR